MRIAPVSKPMDEHCGYAEWEQTSQGVSSLTKDSDTVMRTQFQKEPKPSIMRYANQVLAALSVSMCSMVVGYSSSYTSPGLVSMRDNATATFEVTKENRHVDRIDHAVERAFWRHDRWTKYRIPW